MKTFEDSTILNAHLIFNYITEYFKVQNMLKTTGHEKKASETQKKKRMFKNSDFYSS
jgi:hypothetical protein